MLRLLVISALLISGLFALALGSFHLQARIDPIGETFGDCSMPCWQGVQPGITMRTEALALLKSLGWTLAETPCNAAVYDSCSVFVHSDAGSIDSGEPLTFVYIGADQVKEIALIDPDFTLGDVWLAFGAPQTELAPNPQRATYLNSSLWFGQANLSARIGMACPAAFGDMLQSPVDTVLVWASGTAMTGILSDTSDLRRMFQQVCGL